MGGEGLDPGLTVDGHAELHRTLRTLKSISLYPPLAKKCKKSLHYVKNGTMLGGIFVIRGCVGCRPTLKLAKIILIR